MRPEIDILFDSKKYIYYAFASTVIAIETADYIRKHKYSIQYREEPKIEEPLPEIKETVSEEPAVEVVKEIKPEKKIITGDTYISEHFQVWEFRSADGHKPDRETIENLKQLVANLEVLRTYVERPVNVNSGYRSKAHNATIKGAALNSYHVKGMAVDIWVPGIKPERLAKIIENLIKVGMMDEGGLSIYSNHVHYDIRGKKARW